MSQNHDPGDKSPVAVDCCELDRGDNEFIGTKDNVKEESLVESSAESSLYIIPLFGSKPSTGSSLEHQSLSRDRPDVNPCCVCLELGRQDVSRPTSDQNEDTCALRGANSEPVCRICLEGSGVEGFISPCDCSGTIGMVHRSCLERWLCLLNSSECEICKHKFQVRRYMRAPSQIRLNSLPLDICGDLICIAVLCPICVMVVYFCIEASVKNIQDDHLFIAIAIIVVSTGVVLSYLLWIFCTMKQVVTFWWGCNRVVRISTASQVAPATNNVRTFCRLRE